MYMDNINLFSKKEKEFLIPAVRIYSEYIGMEFGVEKGAMLIMKSRKRQMTEGIELLNQEKIRTLGEKETYKYLKILKAEMSERKEYLRRTRKSLETKLHSRNLIKRLNTLVFPA